MARLTDKLQETVITSNPQTAGLAGEIRPFAGDTAGWPVVDGVRQLKGWAVCEGDILNEADYPDLCANLGGVGNSPWDNFAHPTGQTGTVGAGQFRLPKLNGLHLKSAGDNGVTNPACGDFQDQGTVKNSLETCDSNISATFNSLQDSHTHSRGNMDIIGGVRFAIDGNPFGLVSGNKEAFTGSNTGFESLVTNPILFNNITYNGRTLGNTNTNNSIEGNGFNFRASRSWTGTTNNHSINYTPTLTSGSAAAQALISNDDETRPTSVAVSYIIALYNNVANVITTKDLTISGTLTANAVVDSSGEVITEVIGEVKSSVLTEAQFQSLKGTGWVVADGRPLDCAAYKDLYDLIGGTYGEDVNNNTFNLPDLRERYIRGTGAAEAGLGDFREDTTAKNGLDVVQHTEVKTLSSGVTVNKTGSVNANTTGFWRYASYNIASNNLANNSQVVGIDAEGGHNFVLNGSPYGNLPSPGRNNVDYIGHVAGNNSSGMGALIPGWFPSNSNVNSISPHAFNGWSITAYPNNGYSTWKTKVTSTTNITDNRGYNVSGTTNIDHDHNLTGDDETAPNSLILNYFIKIA